MNPDHVICNLDAHVQLNIELRIPKGRGYVPAEENKRRRLHGYHFHRLHFHPIRNVKYDDRELPCGAEDRLREAHS